MTEAAPLPCLEQREDYVRLFQRIAHAALQASRYGPTAKRHLRMAMLQLAAANYPQATKDARRSIERGFQLHEAEHALGLALLGQALVEAGMLEPGPGAPASAARGVRHLSTQALRVFTECAQRNPHDTESALVRSSLSEVLHLDDERLQGALRRLLPRGPDGP